MYPTEHAINNSNSHISHVQGCPSVWIICVPHCDSQCEKSINLDFKIFLFHVAVIYSNPITNPSISSFHNSLITSDSNHFVPPVDLIFSHSAYTRPNNFKSLTITYKLQLNHLSSTMCVLYRSKYCTTTTVDGNYLNCSNCSLLELTWYQISKPSPSWACSFSSFSCQQHKTKHMSCCGTHWMGRIELIECWDPNRSEMAASIHTDPFVTLRVWSSCVPSFWWPSQRHPTSPTPPTPDSHQPKTGNCRVKYSFLRLSHVVLNLTPSTPLIICFQAEYDKAATLDVHAMTIDHLGEYEETECTPCPFNEISWSGQSRRSIQARSNCRSGDIRHIKAVRNDWTWIWCDSRSTLVLDDERKRSIPPFPTIRISIIMLSQYRSLARRIKISLISRKAKYVATSYNSIRSPPPVRNTRRREYIVPSLILHNNG